MAKYTRSDIIADAATKTGVTKAQAEQHIAELKAGGKHDGPYVEKRERSYYESGSVRCDCGAEHHLERGDSVCDNCGQDYNAVGQRLNPPHMWDDIDHQP